MSQFNLSLSHVGIGTDVPVTLLHVVAAAENNDDEAIARFSVSDNSAGLLQIDSRTSTENEFNPAIIGVGTDAGHEGLYIRGAIQPADDNNSDVAVMTFDVREVGSTAVTTRPLYRWRDANGTLMLMDENGNLGIGTTSPAGRLDVSGTVYIDYSSLPGGSTMTDYFVGINSSGQLLNLGMSSIQFKEQVEDIEFDKEAFLQLRPVDFKWKEFHGGQMDVGLIAQEVEQTFPALASYQYKRTYLPNGDFERDSLGNAVEDTTQTEVGGVRYHKLPVYLLALAKDQQNEIDELRSQLEALTTIVQNCCAPEPSYRMEDGDELNGIDSEQKDIEEYVLLQNDPNPFNDYTDIKYNALPGLDFRDPITVHSIEPEILPSSFVYDGTETKLNLGWKKLDGAMLVWTT